MIQLLHWIRLIGQRNIRRRISSKEEFLSKDIYREIVFRELIMSFVNLRMKGFDQWQDGFSKVMKRFLSPHLDNYFVQYLTYDINLDSEASGLFEEVRSVPR